jgi:hypothetical protein
MAGMTYITVLNGTEGPTHSGWCRYGMVVVVERECGVGEREARECEAREREARERGQETRAY